MSGRAIFLSFHYVQGAYLRVFNVALHVEGVLFEVIPVSAGKPLGLELLDRLGADVLNYGGLELLPPGVVLGGEKKLKRFCKLTELRKIPHAVQQPLVIRCVGAV